MNGVCMEARKRCHIPEPSIKSGQPHDMDAGNTTHGL